MDNNCRPVITDCNEATEETPITRNAPFSLCVGDYTLNWDGLQASVERTKNTPDGEYSKVLMENGCPSFSGQCDAPTYTPPPCVESPAPCGEEGGNTTGVSSNVHNLTRNTASGLLTTVHATVNGQEVPGAGTEDDPLRIPATGSGGDTTVAASGGSITVDPIPSGYSVSLTPTGVSAGTYNGFTINQYGQVTSVDPDSSDVAISDVTAGLGLQVEKIDSTVEVSHVESPADGQQYEIGGYTVGVGNGGHLTQVTRSVNVPAGEYPSGNVLLTVDGLGNITDIQPRPETITPGSFTTADGATVSYNGYGEIVSVTN